MWHNDTYRVRNIVILHSLYEILKHNITVNSYHTCNIKIELTSTIPWMSQSNVNLDQCHNVKKPLDFIIWHQLSSLSQRDNDIVACYIMTYTLMYVKIPHQHSWMSQWHANFDDVAMWHYLLWILKWDINFHECRNLTFININFDGYHNVTSTMMNVAMWHQLWWMSQCDINLLNFAMWHQLG
jgi:hypothetical protein